MKLKREKEIGPTHRAGMGKGGSKIEGNVHPSLERFIEFKILFSLLSP